MPANTLPVLRGVVSGAAVRAPVQQGSGALLQIDQTGSRAVIDWRSFNIGGSSEVRFNQPSRTASVLNRIYSADPSIIQGRLSSAGPIDPKTGLASAGGQIILINQNGILFDRGAQINVYSLIASTLNMSNDFFNKGLLSGENPSNPTPAFAGGYRLDGDGSTDPSIKPQGVIRLGHFGSASAGAPVLEASPGGNILLFAPVIDNKNGLITAPDGQVILAAGRKVYLSGESAAEQGVRGYLVEVSADEGDVNLTSLIRNQGTVSSDRGNVTLAALAINQEGRVSAKTAMLYNGSVWLKAVAKEKTPGGPLEAVRAGTVTLGAGSQTETPIDTSDKTTLAESQSYSGSGDAVDLRSRIRIEGQNVVNKGSITAPGGVISVDASSPATGEKGRIYLAEGSSISAAGNWADADFKDNFATFKVTSNELKDSPDQKTGILKGATVTVDLRKPNSLLDISGYVDGRKRTVAEKAAVGGSVTLSSSGDFIQRQNSTIDVSGGGYNYSGGTSSTSRFVGDNGLIYDIATAPQQRRLVGQLDSYTKTYERWGQTEVFSNPLGALFTHEPAYREGKPGGSLAITAPGGMVIDGTLRGGATTGLNQRSQATPGASFTLGTDTNKTATASTVASLRFIEKARDHLGEQFAEDSELTAELLEQLELGLDTLLPAAGSVVDTLEPHRFSRVEINSRGLVEVPAGLHADAGVGNSLILRGKQIDIAGTVTASAGKVLLETRPVPASGETRMPEKVTIFSGGQIDVSGLWINTATPTGVALGPILPTGFLEPGSSSARSTTQGGSITVSSGSFEVQKGSTLNASGGGTVVKSGKVTGGNAGSIALAADQVQDNLSVNNVRGDLQGFSIAKGGSLSVTVDRAQLGGAGLLADNVVRFDEDFFRTGGFSSYTISALQDLKVAGGTMLRPLAESWVVDARDAAKWASGTPLAEFATPQVLDKSLRAPTDLTLRSIGQAGRTIESKLTMEAGSAIAVDPGGKVSLSALDGMTVDGSIDAPGGAITLAVSGRKSTAPELTLGQDAKLTAQGVFVPKLSEPGFVQGTVYAGGTVSLSATRGSIKAQEGSEINVSGASATLVTVGDLLEPVKTAVVSSNAGLVSLSSQEYSDVRSTVTGNKGGAQSAGGSFAVEFLNRNEKLLPDDRDTPRRIVVTQSAADRPVAADEPTFALDANRLMAGGFDKLRLQSGGRIDFQGDTTLSMSRGVQLDAPEIRLLDAARVDITAGAGSVVLANSFGKAEGVGSVLQGTAASRNNAMASRPVATLAGAGTLQAKARTIDVVGDVVVNGASQTTLTSDHDLRLTGRVVGSSDTADGAVLGGSLVSEGNITLKAEQVYPTTRSSVLVAVEKRSVSGVSTAQPGGVLSIEKPASAGGAVLSADGAIRLLADRISQAGVVKAPLGQISLEASSMLALAPGSITSVSADGLTIPFGTTVDQRDWLYSPTNSRADLNALTAPPGKRIVLAAPVVDVATGASVDLAGGGDVQASEFVAGSGGSIDTFSKTNTVALLPQYGLSSMPVDREIAGRFDPGFGLLTAKPDAFAFDALHVGPGSLVPAGDYVMLPGRYALLPGAFLVNLLPTPTYAGLRDGQSAALINGQTVVPGYRMLAGTSVRESQTIGVVVRPGTSAKTESDYAISNASFFADRADRLRLAAPVLPSDAGQLSIRATAALNLNGDLKASPAVTGGRGAIVDISAPKIAVVDNVDAAAFDSSYVQVKADGLSRLGGNLLLGGERSAADDAVRVTASASDVVFANQTVALNLPELLVVASDQIDIRQGSVLRADKASAPRPTEKLVADSQGALIRLSSTGDADIQRIEPVSGSSGTVSIASGAALGASRSLAIDATRSVLSSGTLDVAAGGSLSLAAGSVALGAVGSAADGLVLSSSELQKFESLGALTIKSYGAIDLGSNVSVGSTQLGQLVLDAPQIRADVVSGGTAVRVGAKNVTLRNSSAAAQQAFSGTGDLTVAAENITLGAGDQALDGFANVALQASGDLVTTAKGTLLSAATTRVQAGRVAGDFGSDHLMVAGTTSAGDTGFDLTFSRPDVPLSAPLNEILPAGARLNVQGKSVSIDTAVAMKSGIFSARATGPSASDGVTLGSSGVIDAGSYSRTLGGTLQTADAGSVSLSAVTGNVQTLAGSSISLGGGEKAGDAGRLEVSAPQGAVVLAGGLDARASKDARQGQVAIDAQQLGVFASLNDRLESAGFADSRSLRARSGDINVLADDVVKARQITLEADSGRINVAGLLDASSLAGGGRIALFAGTGMTLAGVMDVSGTSVDSGTQARPSNGGEFIADVRSGTLAFASGSTIDIRAGTKGKPGQAAFTAAQVGSGVDVDLQGSVSSVRNTGGTPGEVLVQGRRVITDVSGATTADIDQWAQDHSTFVRAMDAAGITGGLMTDASVHLRGALELQAPGDFTLAYDWNLTTANWLAGQGSGKEAGTLTVRAAGDIVIERSLGLPSDQLVDAPTWSIQMASGADLAAANPLALQSLDTLGTKGNFRMAPADEAVIRDRYDADGYPVLDFDSGGTAILKITQDQSAKIRTGSGSISIAAGRDFVFEAGSRPQEDATRVIYTAGRPAAPGDTSAAVQGIDTPWADGGGNVSIVAQRDAVGQSNQWINAWLRRPRGNTEDVAVGQWFVYRPNFQQNLGALGGGNVNVHAGRDVLDLSAMLPTMGRSFQLGDVNQLEVTGGGNLSVMAGNRIEGGEYLVGLGTGQLQAGGSVGSERPTQIFLMGTHDDSGSAGASMKISARTGVSLQSVDNPTALAMPQARALGPAQIVKQLDGDGNAYTWDDGSPIYFVEESKNFAASTQNKVASFFTYANETSARQALRVESLSGNVTIGAAPLDKPALQTSVVAGPSGTSPSRSAFPGQLQAVAFDGAVRGQDEQSQINLFPFSAASLGLFARGDIDQLRIDALDVARVKPATWDVPSESTSNLFGLQTSEAARLEAMNGAYRYEVVSESGSISASSLRFADRARVQAGVDISDTSLTLQNQSASDVSVVRAVSGDVQPRQLSMAGPGRLLIQSGRSIDLGGRNPQGGVRSTGNQSNPTLSSDDSARLIFIAGVEGDVDLSRLDGAFAEFKNLNERLNDALGLYKLLDTEPDPNVVLGAKTVADLLGQNPGYRAYIELDKDLPQILSGYQKDLKDGRLPLGRTAASARAKEFYALLNAETDDARLSRIKSASSFDDLIRDSGFSSTYGNYSDLIKQYPVLFTDYVVRRSNGYKPEGVTPIVFGGVIDDSVAKVFPAEKLAKGDINSFLTAIQSTGGSFKPASSVSTLGSAQPAAGSVDLAALPACLSTLSCPGIDLIAPRGDITVGLTTAKKGADIGVITTGGGDIRSYLEGNFNINQGKVVTAQGGSILIFSSRGNIDAGRGARTSQSSPAPVRVAIVEDGVTVGYISRIPPGFSGSGIQTLTSDPDGKGPEQASVAGSVYLFTPAGYVDAGEAGIVSGGDIFIAAQTVLNASNISSSGNSTGVPVSASGSLAASVASSGGTANTSKAGEDAANSAAAAAKAAAAAEGMQKPSILTVEVVGFGDKNCKESAKECLGSK